MEQKRFNELVVQISSTDKYKELKSFKHHGNVSVYEHMHKVALLSYKLSKSLDLDINYEALVRGAMLHDYYFYDWHDKNKGFRGHGYKHPKIALKNTSEEFDLDEIEADIISKHMFPLTPFKVPRFYESWVVSLIDKYVAVLDIISICIKYRHESSNFRRRRHGLRRHKSKLKTARH